ncbi:MAG: transcriptional repressor LexA [Coriobacteriaceae bacterium]|nr:transcriptional repressor LexA [Coriobacteriaceae bacterium]
MAAPQKLTARQKEVLDYIQTCIDEKHYPPSVREIGEALGLSSPSTVHAHLAALERKGYINRDASKSRSVVLTDASTDATDKASSAAPAAGSGTTSNVVHLPLVGKVAAGAPILAEQNIEEEVPLPTSLVGDANSFLLTVQGDSMVDAGILDGDTVIVREQQTANDGDIVVALIEDEATVKTYYREADCIRLQPQNAAMEPIFTRDARILGVVTGLFRSV